jgi:hypothetical protein
MKRVLGFVTVSALLMIAIAPVRAQQPAPGPPGGAHEHGQLQSPAPGQQAPVPGQPGPGRPHGGGMGGMRGGGGMMSGGMGGMRGGMMGGMRGGRGGEGPMALCPTAMMMAHHDAKANARSLRLCGDLLKAMGDVLVKHGAELEKAGR